MIQPAFTLPIMGASSREFWRSYDGSNDGVWTTITTNGGSDIRVFTNPSDRSIGVVQSPLSEQIMFSVSGLITAAVLGTSESIAAGLILFAGHFTSTDDRVWSIGFNSFGTANQGGYLFEYDGTGFTGQQGPTDDFIGNNGVVTTEAVSTEIDTTRALASLPSAAGLRIAILQRTGGVLESTVNFVDFGSTSGTRLRGAARPLNGTRSLAVHVQDAEAAEPHTLVAQGIAHAGTTPSATGSPSTIDTNVDGAESGNGGEVRLTKGLDGLAPSKGRFIAAWRDDTSGNVQLAIVQYDGSTIAIGSTLDTGFNPSTTFGFNIKNLGGGNAVLVSGDDADGWLMVHYAAGDVDDLSLELNAGGAQSITLDGDASGDAIQGLNVAVLSENRFALSARNTTDGEAQVKIIHNGLGS